MHIASLTAALGRTRNADLILLFDEQLSLSRNSLRLIDREIRARGGTYAPTWITVEYDNAIIGSPAEERVIEPAGAVVPGM